MAEQQAYAKFIAGISAQKHPQPTPKELDTKMNWSEVEKCWVCNICQKKVRTAAARRKHFRKDCANQQPQNPSWQLGWIRGASGHGCRYCKQTFSKRRGIRRHLQLKMCPKIPDWNRLFGTGKALQRQPGPSRKKKDRVPKAQVAPNSTAGKKGLLGPIPGTAQEDSEEDSESSDGDEEESSDWAAGELVQGSSGGQPFSTLPPPGLSTASSQVALPGQPGWSLAQRSERILAQYSGQGSQDQVRDLDAHMTQRSYGMDRDVGLTARERSPDCLPAQRSERILAQYSGQGSQDQIRDLNAHMTQRSYGIDRDVGLPVRERSPDCFPAQQSERILARYSGQGLQDQIRDLDAHISHRQSGMDRDVGLPARESIQDQIRNLDAHMTQRSYGMDRDVGLPVRERSPDCLPAQRSERILVQYSGQGSQDQIRDHDAHISHRRSGMDRDVGLTARDRSPDYLPAQWSHYSGQDSQDQIRDLDAHMSQRSYGKDRDVGLPARESIQDYLPTQRSDRILARYPGQGSQDQVRDLDAHISHRRSGMDRDVGLTARERSPDWARGYENRSRASRSSEYLRQSAEHEAEERVARQFSYTQMSRPDSYPQQPSRNWPKQDVDLPKSLPDRSFHTSHRDTSEADLSKIHRERTAQAWSNREHRQHSAGNPQEQYDQNYSYTQGSGIYNAPSRSQLTGFQLSSRVRDPDRGGREVMSDRTDFTGDRSGYDRYDNPGRSGPAGNDLRRMPATEGRLRTGRYAEGNQRTRGHSPYPEGGGRIPDSPGGRSRSPVRQRETGSRSEFGTRYPDKRTRDSFLGGYEQNTVLEEQSRHVVYREDRYQSRSQMPREYTSPRDQSYHGYQSDRGESRHHYKK